MSAQHEQTETCCAPECHASSVITGRDLPLCEPHLIIAYRRIGEYLRSKQDEAESAKPTLDRQYDPIGLPNGICPKCSGVCLGAHLESGDVACLRASCGYTATAKEWQALVQQYTEEHRPNTEVVYYLRFGELVKIGTTRSLISRLAAIPHDELLATEPGGHRLERQRHEQFAHLRATVGTTREWFTLTPELAQHIADVSARQAV